MRPVSSWARHQPPAFVERHGGGHLAEHGLSGAHGRDAYLGVYLHARAADDRVQIVTLEHPQIVFRAFGIPFGLAITACLHQIDGPIEVGFLDIAQRGDLDARIQRKSQQVRAPSSDADDAQADRCRGGLPQNGRSQTRCQRGRSAGT